MTNKEEVSTIIFECFEEMNEREGINIPINGHAQLFGRGGHLDSLGLVNLIVNIEEKVNDKWGVAISLADEKAMSQKTSPFLNADALSTYICNLLEETES